MSAELTVTRPDGSFFSLSPRCVKSGNGSSRDTGCRKRRASRYLRSDMGLRLGIFDVAWQSFITTIDGMDFLSDNNNVLLETVLPLLEGLNKSASSGDASDAELAETAKEDLRTKVAAYPPTLFVKQASREYPCSNRTETTLSYAYAAYADGGDSRVCPALRKTAALLGCEALIDGVDALFAEDADAAEDVISKSASVEDGAYALVVGDKKNYPAGNRVEISDSAMKLSGDLPRMPVFHSRIASRNLVKRASETGLATDSTVFPPSILKRAEQRIPAQDGIDLVRKQREPVYSEKALGVLDEILTKVASTNINSLDGAEALLAQVEKMDAAVGLKYRSHGGQISDPYASIFRGPTTDMVKSASEQMVRVAPAGQKPHIVHFSRLQDAAQSAPPADFLSDTDGEFLQKIASVTSATEANVLLTTATDTSVSLLAKLLGTPA